MKVIDEKGRIFGKINIFDLIILLSLLIAIGAVGYKVISDKMKASGIAPTTTYIVTVKSLAMSPSYTEALKKDDKIYFDNFGYVNAKIVGVSEEPAMITVQTSDGNLIETQSPNLVDVTVDIEVIDSHDTPDIRVGRYAVAVGGKFTVKTIYAMGMDSEVIAIREK